ncbi:uncharacterized protein LOC131068358 isoform X2 [Cryptomeria japonica]|uniref:uncharacterized protein LOC131068358 isoform X2 n=1 Tax=Cryptomeria japonica TaxID=3369 RepID=UPI0027DA431D|nr:uncharacterized protein LOC131068358 isoform X2 [Cryptomeria japonica]
MRYVSRNASAINGARLMGRKRKAASSDCHGNSVELCTAEERGLSPMYAIHPVEDCPQEFVSEVHLEEETTIESLPSDIWAVLVQMLGMTAAMSPESSSSTSLNPAEAYLFLR